MKQISVLFIFLLVTFAAAAQKKISEGTVNTALTVSMGERVVSEQNLVTVFNKDNVKISITGPATKNDIFIDRPNSKITSLYEMFGKKLGFFVYDTATVVKARVLSFSHLMPKDSVKNINGIPCKLAYLHYDSIMRMKDVKVWYDPRREFAETNMGLNIPGIELIKGVPVLITSEAPNGMVTVYTLLSIDDAAKIDPAQFVIPSNFSITSQQEFQRTVQQLSRQGM